MSARIARRAFTATARRSFLKPGLSLSASRVRKASTSASHGSEPASDKPWIIGSLLVFGPALLYLISPSARKSPHLEHKHDSPAHSHDSHSEEKTPEPELMKDDEGVVADVASSVTLAESSDVPNDAKSAEELAEFKEAAEDHSPKPVEQDSATAPPNTKEEEGPEKAEKSETTEEGEKKPLTGKEPTNMGEARKSAVEHTTPKEGAERKN